MGNGQTQVMFTSPGILKLFAPDSEQVQLQEAARARVDWRGWLGAGMLACAAVFVWRRK